MTSSAAGWHGLTRIAAVHNCDGHDGNGQWKKDAVAVGLLH
jgi:hypothetical protein